MPFGAAECGLAGAPVGVVLLGEAGEEVGDEGHHDLGSLELASCCNIIALTPLALRGVRYTPASAHDLLRRNLTRYGIGGLISPFLGIKRIDLLISQIPGLG
ncbi:hypothetical protein [Streptomyces sp. NEAU-S7GS2]|uniref:hypothetical protein n=1 Tax=Streptomyces sp. NEAU-S7GS2 TaxID=2202000 RepID=UPI000D6FF1E4|nr:hypothetical protein [Streptomyces sp. NEAU-S7GS2]AWN30660.1 hypothetical protein DKG71_35315 [Streptomyces sp. NEAU-S7GS2]